MLPVSLRCSRPLLAALPLLVLTACQGRATGPDAGLPDSGAPDAALPDAGPPDAGAPDAGRPFSAFAFVSGYSSKISVYRVDLDAGTFTHQSDAPANQASFLAVSPDHRFLYAIEELNPGRVAAYAIDGSSGGLTPLGTASSAGQGPAFVSVDATGRWVLVANYGDGTAAVLPALPDGGLADAGVVLSPGVNAHQFLTDPSNRYAFIPCLGSDHVAQYRFDAADGGVSASSPADLATAADAGPRHLAFHPSAPYAYLVNEKDSTVTSLGFNATTGLLGAPSTQTTLPPGFTGTNTAAEVQVHPSGKFVYASNRGANDLAVFHVDAATGHLTLFNHMGSGGTQPRHFSIDPTGTFLFAANQGTGNVYAFRVSATDGSLGALGKVADFPSATFVGVYLFPQ